MDSLVKYNILNSTEEFNIEHIEDKEGQKNSTLRANVFMSFALMGSMSLNPVNVASNMNSITLVPMLKVFH